MARPSVGKGVFAFFFFFFFFFDHPSEFSKQLTLAMENRGMDAVDLAGQADVALITVKRWLHGEFEPRHKNLQKIARVLHTTPNALCGIADAHKTQIVQIHR